MHIGDVDLAREPIGRKWYVQSGHLRLIVLTDLGPVDAAQILIYRAVFSHRQAQLGEYIMCSQRGFDFVSTAYFTDTKKFAGKICCIPRAALEGVPG